MRKVLRLFPKTLGDISEKLQDIHCNSPRDCFNMRLKRAKLLVHKNKGQPAYMLVVPFSLPNSLYETALNLR